MLKFSISEKLKSANSFIFSSYAIMASFCTYSCMYAFRKPFAVATFDDIDFFGINYKILLITAQIIGYTLSKFLGIKIVSEMKGDQRPQGIILLITIAGLALLFFAIIPPPYNIIFLFVNGLPLGMVWGLVFSYLEGRRVTEVLGAGLSVSFIFSSGFVKSIGKIVLLNWNVSTFWMPFITGMLFFLPLLFFVGLLSRIPPPTTLDEALRTKRAPMNKARRREFIINFRPGLILLILAYTLLTAFRDFRDNFAVEIWNSLGYGSSPEVFTITEIPVAIGVLIIMGSIMLIKSNYKALITNHFLIFTGISLIGLATLAFEHGWLGAPAWMILIGFGLYVGYVPFNSIFFDRLIASFKYAGNVGFVIYLADSFGYLGSVTVLFYKEFGKPDLGWIPFFISSGYLLAIVGGTLTLGSLLYFQFKYEKALQNLDLNQKSSYAKPSLD